MRQRESGAEGSPCGRGFRSHNRISGKEKVSEMLFDTVTLHEPRPDTPATHTSSPHSPQDASAVSKEASRVRPRGDREGDQFRSQLVSYSLRPAPLQPQPAPTGCGGGGHGVKDCVSIFQVT